MGHELEAFVGRGRLRERFLRTAPLAQDVVLVPLSAIGPTRTGDATIAPFRVLTPRLLAAARACVGEDVPFGYIETEYFGGTGEQRAAAWLGDAVLVAPAERPEVVNEVLRALGVVRVGIDDEWDTVDLIRYRSPDELERAMR